MVERREEETLEECTAPEARVLPRELEDCVLRIMLVTRVGGGEKMITYFFRHYLSPQESANTQQLAESRAESACQCDRSVPQCLLNPSL